MHHLKVVVHRHGEKEPGTTISIPLAVARIAAKILPRRIREDLEKEGFDLNEVLAVLAKERITGQLVDIQRRNERIVISVE